MHCMFIDALTCMAHVVGRLSAAPGIRDTARTELDSLPIVLCERASITDPRRVQMKIDTRRSIVNY